MLVLHLGDVEGLHNALQAPLLELGALKASQEPLDVLSAWPSEVRVAIETGVFEPTTAWRDFSMDDLTSLTDSFLEAKAVISLGRNPFPAALLSDLPDLAGIPMPKAGGSGAARPGAEGPDRPHHPPSLGLWRDELRCRGP